MKAMIFAAGLGTRLKPITDSLPKALVPVGGKPLIEHVCKKLKDAGVDEAVVNVHHFADKVQEWVSVQQIMELRISDEREILLETGGAVLHARNLLEGSGSFLIHNVDILSDLDIRWFASNVPQDSIATLLVSDRKSSRQLLFDPDTMLLVGWRNCSTGEVRSPYMGLDPDRCLAYAFSGIHIMSDMVFDAMEKYAQTHGLRMTSRSPRFPVMDFYLWACMNYNIYGVLAPSLNLIDVGKLDSLGKAESFLSEL